VSVVGGRNLHRRRFVPRTVVSMQLLISSSSLTLRFVVFASLRMWVKSLMVEMVALIRLLRSRNRDLILVGSLNVIV